MAQPDEPTHRLSALEVRAALEKLPDWQRVGSRGTFTACLSCHSPAAAALVAQFALLLGLAHRHLPWVSVRDCEVTVSWLSPDGRGLTALQVRLAERLAAVAEPLRGTAGSSRRRRPR